MYRRTHPDSVVLSATLPPLTHWSHFQSRNRSTFSPAVVEALSSIEVSSEEVASVGHHVGIIQVSQYGLVHHMLVLGRGREGGREGEGERKGGREEGGGKEEGGRREGRREGGREGERESKWERMKEGGRERRGR